MGKFNSGLERSLRKANVRASCARHASISLRNSASTSAVPPFRICDSAYLSKEPLRMDSRENNDSISSHRSAYSVYLKYLSRALDGLSDWLGLWVRQS